MVSNSKMFAVMSRAMYGQGFIDELAELFRQNGVRSLLECGCGDGYILSELAKRDFRCLGIDSNDEMISLAEENSSHRSVVYKKKDWLSLDELTEFFDAVMCRGNSISYADSWDGDVSSFDANRARRLIEESIGKFFTRLRPGGLLYIDTTSQKEIDLGEGPVNIQCSNIQIQGRVTHDWESRKRYICGSGFVEGQPFTGEAVSYLMKPDEIVAIVSAFRPQRVFTPNLTHEQNYAVICAIK